MGDFINLGNMDHCRIYKPDYDYNVEFYYNDIYTGSNGYNKDFGFSVRCLKDK